MSSRLRLGVLVSGTGTTLQALIDACQSGEIPAAVAVVVSNVPQAFALERARRAAIPAVVVDHRTFPTKPAFEATLRETLESHRVDLVCLAGWLRILSPAFVGAFRGRIMNIHPALLPAFGGRGMYGDRVHQAVLASGARVSGCTVHLVTEVPDGGPIIAQATVPVRDDDTPVTLAARVRREEVRLYPLAVRLFAEGRLRIEGAAVRILAETAPPSAEAVLSGSEGTPGSVSATPQSDVAAPGHSEEDQDAAFAAPRSGPPAPGRPAKLGRREDAE